MAFRVTIQVTCDTIGDAQEALTRLGRTHKTWDEMGETKITTTAQTGTHLPARENVSPGEPSIGKIGKETTETLVGLIKNGQQPAQKWIDHAKLLWKRGLVKFDGKDYYL